MDHKEFIHNALKTESDTDVLNINKEYLIATLTMCQYSAEILDGIKKQAFYGNHKGKLDEQNILNRLEVVEAASAYLRLFYTEKEPIDSNLIPNINTRLSHAVIGMVTESGELAEAMLNAIDNDGVFDEVNLGEEFFDHDWYKAVGCDEMELEWEKGWDRIINKLRVRFGDKFDAAKAASRDLGAEREQLERD